MPLQIPNLDTKNFDHFFEESIAVLPSLSPKWTDYNLSDPGITLLELFSWLSDINMYRLNRVDKKHLLKYLKILGVNNKKVVPAKFWISCENKEEKTIEIPKGTKLEVQAKNTAQSIPFITQESVIIGGNTLSEISLKNERGSIQYENAVFPIFFYPFGEGTREESYFEISFDKEFDKNFSLTFILYEDNLPPLIRSNDEEFDIDPSAILKWEGAEIIKDETYNFNTSGTIYFYNINKTKTIKCILDSGRFENAPRIKKILIDAIKVIQIETFNETTKGNNLPNQKCILKNRPIYKLNKLSIDNEIWEEIDTLEAHNHKEKVYKLDKNSGNIVFGDGIYGKVPHLNSNIDSTYTTSLGEAGNIMPNSLWKFKRDKFKSINIKGYLQEQLGKNPQTIDEAFIEFRKDLQTPSQAVTSKDYEYIATHTPNIRVARAKALAMGKNSVDVIVVPFSLQDKPIPTDNFLKTVCKHLNKHRLITTKITAIQPQYTLISISVEIKLQNGIRESEAKESIQNKISNFLHPLTGWKDKKGWPFGQPLYQSDIYALLENDNNIDCIHYLNIYAQGAFEKYDNGNVILNKDSLTLSNIHNISFVNIQKECRSSI